MSACLISTVQKHVAANTPPGVQRVAKSFEDNNLPDGPPSSWKSNQDYENPFSLSPAKLSILQRARKSYYRHKTAYKSVFFRRRRQVLGRPRGSRCHLLQRWQLRKNSYQSRHFRACTDQPSQPICCGSTLARW